MKDILELCCWELCSVVKAHQPASSEEAVIIW